MAGPTVTLTFAGDATKLDKAMSGVGDGADKMAKKVGDSSEKVRGAGGGLDAVGDKADGAEQKFIGLGDIINGTGDVMQGFKDGDVAGVAMGLADLAGGIASFVIPVLGSLASFLKVQLFTALSFIAAHPIVFALLALAAVFVLLWVNSETFRNIVIDVFNTVAGFLTRSFGAAVQWVVDRFNGLVGWFASLPGRIGGFFSGVGSAIVGAFRWAFNWVADAWNNTVGRINFTVPSWVPFIGGAHFGVPNIQKYHSGGVVPGAPGSEVLAILQAGETVTPANRAPAPGPTRLVVTGSADSAVATLIMSLIRSGQIQLA